MKYLLFFIYAFTFFARISAQQPSEFLYLADSFPEKEYIFLEEEADVEVILTKDDSLHIIKTNKQKIYFPTDKAGLYGSDQVTSSYFRRLLSIEAYSLSPDYDKDKYKKSKVKDFDTKETISNDHFYDDNTVTSFEFENMKQGAITFVESKHKYIDPHFSQQFFFGTGSPTLSKKVTFRVEQGTELLFDYFNMSESDLNYSSKREGKITIHTWVWNNIPPIKFEPSAPHPRHVIPHMIVRIAKYRNKSGEEVNVLAALDDLHKWYSELLGYVKCDDEQKLTSVLEELDLENDNELAKVKKVFNWVQKNVKYIAIEDGLGGFVPRDPDLVMTRRYGDCKDMSTLIVNMLRLAGVEAHKVWIGTRDIPYGYSELPSPAVDNHMIAAYFDKTSNKYIFLDATDSYIEFGMPTQFIQGKEALIHLNESAYKVVKVPVVSAHENRYEDSLVLRLNENQLLGKGTLNNTGYFSNDYRYNLASVTNDKAIKSFVKNLTQKGSNKYQLNEFKINQTDKEVHFTYDFKLDSYVHGDENERYINLNLDKLFTYFTDYKDDRKYPVEEDFKRTFHFYFKLITPEDYMVDYLPKNQSFKHDKFSFDLSYEQEGNDVVYELNVVQDYLMLEVAELEAFNEMIKRLKSAYKESIVIIKK